LLFDREHVGGIIDRIDSKLDYKKAFIFVSKYGNMAKCINNILNKFVNDVKERNNNEEEKNIWL
jgi:hypothetical protein